MLWMLRSSMHRLSRGGLHCKYSLMLSQDQLSFASDQEQAASINEAQNVIACLLHSVSAVVRVGADDNSLDIRFSSADAILQLTSVSRSQTRSCSRFSLLLSLFVVNISSTRHTLHNVTYPSKNRWYFVRNLRVPVHVQLPHKLVSSSFIACRHLHRSPIMLSFLCRFRSFSVPSFRSFQPCSQFSSACTQCAPLLIV